MPLKSRIIGLVAPQITAIGEMQGEEGLRSDQWRLAPETCLLLPALVAGFSGNMIVFRLQDRPDVAARRRIWRAAQPFVDADKLVFIARQAP